MADRGYRLRLYVVVLLIAIVGFVIALDIGYRQLRVRASAKTFHVAAIA